MRQEMKIGITYDLKSDWDVLGSDPQDANAEFDKPQTLEAVIEALESGGHTVQRIGNVHALLKIIDHLDVDLVFNICEGRIGRNRESQVPILLELKGIPYVGSDGLTLALTLDKVMAKKCFLADGIPTPRFFVASSLRDLEGFSGMSFPLMVKTSQEGSSKGINESSRVNDMEGVKRQVALINSTYDQPALIEEFIEGYELTVAVLGNENPEAMPPVQVSIDGSVDLGEQFYTFARITSDSLQYVCPARISESLNTKLKELAVQVYKSVGCRDFGRVDFRVDRNNNPYVLEINPLPALGHDDIFNLFPQFLGSTYGATVNQIVDFAATRCGLKTEVAQRG